MSQQNTMAGKAAADLVQAIATKLYGEAGAGITDLITLANRVEASAAGGLGLLLDQQRVTVVTDHPQAVPPATVGAHEVHPEVVHVRLNSAEVRELGPTPDALVHGTGVRQKRDPLVTPPVGATKAAAHLQSHPLLGVARRNIRQFLAKASFSSSVDRWSASQCLDVMEAAIDASLAQTIDLAALRAMLDGWKNSDYPFSYEGQCAQRALNACVADLQDWLDREAVGNG